MGPTVLVVESELARRQEMGAWLEAEGFDVLTCPGPSAPSYTCVGTDVSRCALERAADVVVLDMELASDNVFRGAPGWQLLVFYLERGDRVVALSSPEDSVRPRSDADVTVLPRPADRRSLVEAVRALSTASGGGSHGHDTAR